jgi:hypothetical protein
VHNSLTGGKVFLIVAANLRPMTTITVVIVGLLALRSRPTT